MATIQGQLNTPRDTTLQATNTALGLLAKDATIGATNTALGLLGKDASLQDIKAALLQIVAALDPTADDYDQLSNKPQVNGVTLTGNKTSKQLGIRQTIPLTSAQYAQLTSAEKMDVDKDYIITDANATAAPINDDSVSRNSVWSSYKVDEELDTLNSALSNKADTSALTPLKVYGIVATLSAHQGNGNFRIGNLPGNTVPICVAPWSATDCNMTLFYSSTQHAWYVHCSKFADGTAETSATITTAYLYYVEYTALYS